MSIDVTASAPVRERPGSTRKDDGSDAASGPAFVAALLAVLPTTPPVSADSAPADSAPTATAPVSAVLVTTGLAGPVLPGAVAAPALPGESGGPGALASAGSPLPGPPALEALSPVAGAAPTGAAAVTAPDAVPDPARPAPADVAYLVPAGPVVTPAEEGAPPVPEGVAMPVLPSAGRSAGPVSDPTLPGAAAAPAAGPFAPLTGTTTEIALPNGPTPGPAVPGGVAVVPGTADGGRTEGDGLAPRTEAGPGTVLPPPVVPLTAPPVAVSAVAPAAAAPPPAAHLQVLTAVSPLLHAPDGSYSLELQLHPRDLGPVQVTLQMRHGELSIHLHAADPSAGDLLRDSLPDLREQLEAQGQRTGGLDVGSGRQDQRTAPDPRALESSAARPARSEEPSGASAPAADRSAHATGGVDVRL